MFAMQEALFNYISQKKNITSNGSGARAAFSMVKAIYRASANVIV